MRKIIIGDIHGCLTKLKKLLDKIHFNKTEDTIIFVGDYTDRGKENYETVLYIKALKEEMSDKCVLLLGNHEDMMLESLAKCDNRLWFRNGGIATAEDFKDKAYTLNDYADFIKGNMGLYYKSEQFDVCHAGVDRGVEKDSRDILIWDRCAIEFGYDGKFTIVGHTPLDKPYWNNGRNDCYYGYKKKYDIPECGILAIDTGCVYGGYLTALVIENDKMKFYHN